MAKKKPRIEYKWRRIDKSVVFIQNEPAYFEYECTWSLYSANGEYMCGSGSEGYRDKTDARRAVFAVTYALSGFALESEDPLFWMFKEVGPGKKPQ